MTVTRSWKEQDGTITVYYQEQECLTCQKRSVVATTTNTIPEQDW